MASPSSCRCSAPSTARDFRPTAGSTCGPGRSWPLSRGELAFFTVVQNLTAEHNVRGFDIELEALPDGSVEVGKEEKLWGRLIPSFGVRWSF